MSKLLRVPTQTESRHEEFLRASTVGVVILFAEKGGALPKSRPTHAPRAGAPPFLILLAMTSVGKQMGQALLPPAPVLSSEDQ